MDKIDWSPPDLSEDDKAAMKKVIDSGWMSEGKITEEFEEKLAKKIGCRHAIVVNNATTALLTILWAHGFRPGDEIIVPAYTFIATVNTPNAVGCRAVLSDSNLHTLNSEPELMKPKLTKKTKAIIPVDIAGMPVDIDAFRDFAEDNGLILVEDAAEALGASYKGKNIGSFEHAAAFSFHMAKLITTIEGGCIATNNDELADKCRMIKNHGTLKKGSKTQFFSFGANFRTTEVQSALGISQLSRLDQFLERRQRVVKVYLEELEGLVKFQEVPDYVTRHARMFFPIFVDAKKRARINEEIQKQGIATRIVWPPAHKQPYHGKLFPGETYPNAEKIADTIITIPVGNKTSYEEAKTVADAVKKALKMVG